MSTRPSAIRTFLIADIRGYTRFTDQFGDEAASRLATTFAQIVAEAMEAWDGRLVELRGDEALCTFDSPRAALRCAMELQQVFAEEASGSPELPLHVGIGLDVGEAVPVGDGYRGAALNLAARLCSGASAGEIRATQNLAHVAGPIPGVVYEPQGTEQLKGVAADVAIVRVRSSQENASTPLVGRPRGRPLEALPAELESAVPLVGREADLLWLRWHWRRARHGHGGAVELVGPQGIGKSRLVAELARLAHAEGALVSLAPVPEAEGPALVVLEDVDRTPAAAPETIGEVELRAAGRPLLAILTRREVDGGGRPRRVLEPLTEADVIAIAALYANEPGDPAPARRILAESGGVPLAVHRIASQWARTAAMHRMGESARRTSRERRGLRAEEEELIGHFANLELTRERARMYGPEGPAASGVCPYKGLAAYEAADAEYYFGREQLIGELVARVVGSSFVGLVGASGSGKSSVLSAGLLPALANGVLPGSNEWIQVPMRPGSQPMRHLADALRRASPATTSEGDAEEILDRLAATMAPAQRLLLVIDQFEEVFTADESERERFLGLITEPRPSSKVVLAVRADQYERCAAYPRLARLLAADQVLVGPIGREEVAAIARHPAERVGLRVEPELIEALIADLGTEPGAMPLLSTALLELWEAREDGRLTLAAYRTTGGVQGAVARLAESAYARLEPEEQEAARSLFMRLVGEGSEPETIVRRRLSMDELDTIGDPRIATVVEKLTTGRLLTRDEGTAEVAHEALIREWPRLREWIEADAAGRQVRLRLIESARSWDAGGRGEEDLYRGARLAAALEWSTERATELNAVERDFLDASRESAERAEVRQRRTNRILRGLLAGAGVLLLAAVGAGVVAFVQAGENAENASMSQVRELSLSALSLTSDDPQLALLLAAEAVELSREAGREPPASALQALWSAYVAGKSTTTIPDAGARAIAYSPDGTVLVVDAPESPELLVTLRDPSTGEQVDAIARTEEVGDVERLAFSPNGRWLAVATTGPAGAGQGSVSIFDTSSRDLVHGLEGVHDGYRELFLTDGGLIAAAGTTSGQREIGIMAWDVASGEERAII
ncbi:MAG TPA: AAA family ATPase, partial [Candidatus Limnocylindria bacterium]|nr:AAA family ATPase [Candidatus Limnocylindria bacterium]